MSIEIKKSIQEAIQQFKTGNITDNAIALFNCLGYNTDRQSPLSKPTFDTFRDSFIADHCRFHEEKALANSWKYVDLLFQLSKDEISQQNSLFDTKQVDRTIIETYLFFAIELHPGAYSRTALSQITREVNKLFPMPVMVLFKMESSLTLSIINRRLHKRDESRDVLEKVTLIKDISIGNPHRAHIEILFDLSFPELLRIHNFTNFVELHHAWQKTLDIKELNKRFYLELSNWYFWAKDKVSFPADVEKDDEKRNSISLIRLITRIIFIWFIKEKNLIPEDLFDGRKLKAWLNDFNGSSKSSNFYNAILQNLFFGTLNQKMGERGFARNGSLEENRSEYGVKNMFRYADQFAISEKEALALFANIPFLNGGLFDCLDKEDENRKVQYSDGFSRNPKKRANVPDFLFYGIEQDCDLNEIYGTRNKRYRVRGLIEILSSYKFTIAENTPLEEEVALDPELLGKVFENLLASYNPETRTTARKQTGSFYTPREIVDYMVETTMFGNEDVNGQCALIDTISGTQWHGKEAELENRLRHLLSYSSEGHTFDRYDVDILIGAIDACKILDPACGSGAFPMGILHKLVLVLHKLDPKNERWKKRQIQKIKQVEDPVQREQIIEGIEEAFRNNELDYGRKLFLIENCIYGVDIQPIAVQIAKLRFFISLIIDQNKRSDKDNFNIRSLPNLETKFVAADTLIGLQQQGVLRNVEIEELEAELKTIRHDYFSARTRKDKLAFQKKDKELRQKIAAMLEQSGWDSAIALQIANFDQNKSADFFDFEWMFGLKPTDESIGIFDIVIGNPPYVQIQNFSGMQQQKDWEKQKYATYVKTGDVYCLFYERGYQLLKNGGVLTYITSNKWMRANYGKVMRKYFNANGSILRLIDFGDSPIFENATTYTNILVWKKEQEEGKEKTRAWDLSKVYASDTTLEEMLEKQGECDALFNEDSYVVVKGEQTAIKRRIEQVGTPLKEWDIHINYGIKTGLNEAFIIDGKKKNELIKQDLKSSEILKPMIRGRDIKRYAIDFADLWIIIAKYGSNKILKDNFPAIYRHLIQYRSKLQDRGQCTNHGGEGQHHWLELDNNPTDDYLCQFDGEKIVYAEIVYDSAFYFDANGYYPEATLFVLTGHSLRYLTAMLNSKLLTYAFKTFYAGGDLRGSTFRYKKVFLELLPVPSISKNAQIPYEILVDCILFCKSHSLDSESSLLESVIDGLVFDLYFPAEMKAAHCYITDRIASVLKPFKKSDSVSFKKEYISELCKFINKDETVYHGLIHRRTIKEVQIITGETT
jgi:adenine-specific DNA-methyltransferase